MEGRKQPGWRQGRWRQGSHDTVDDDSRSLEPERCAHVTVDRLCVACPMLPLFDPDQPPSHEARAQGQVDAEVLGEQADGS
eukprot:132686-Rhodomonas_salina.1